MRQQTRLLLLLLGELAITRPCPLHVVFDHHNLPVN
jgi:hypothetical protein